MNKPFLNCALIALLALVVSCAPTRDLSVAPKGDQSIVIWHRLSGERIDVTTRRNGQYNKEAFDQIDHIFRDRHTGEEYPIDPKLIDVITDLRDKLLMSPSDPIELLSGFRSPESNRNLAKTNKYVAKNSYHMKGQAADIRIPEMNSSALEAVAKTMQRGGVALYPDSGHVHVDTGPVRGWSVIRGKEAGLNDRIRKPGESAPMPTVRGRVPVQPRATNLKVKPITSPINSYDDLPEPAAPDHAKILPAVTPKHAPKIIGGATVTTKQGVPVRTAPKAIGSKAAAKPAAPQKKTVEDAKKQWVKTPYHGGVQGGVKTPAKAPAKKPVAKKPAKKE
ncbi:MAG: DUF882 domain-containing protein [Alphaproteobacteria bacterium]|nr:DUF882 domain-containing protein [Alphaproteobacteria bacterium]